MDPSSDDIVARLRQSHRGECQCFGCEAAAEIERLRARAERLEDILRGAAPLIEGEVE